MVKPFADASFNLKMNTVSEIEEFVNICSEIPFEVNKALISRSMVIKLEPLTKQDITKIIQ